MERNEIHDDLQEIFRTVFDDSTLSITDNTTSSDIEDWDSLEQINLIVGIEKKFNIKFKLEEVTGLANVGAMIDLISSKVKNE